MNRQVHDEAAGFLVELQSNDSTPAMRKAFDTWLRASPQHIRAYLQVLAGWDDAALLTGASIEQLVEMARQAPNVTALRALVSRTPSNERISSNEDGGAPRRFTIKFAGKRGLAFARAAGFVILVLCAVAIYGIGRERAAPTYATKTGELLTLQLTDGSTIDLNTQSQIRVRFSGKSRAVELIAGQAMFRVAKDAHRPFVVKTADTQVQAMGTAFDVRRNKMGTTVTVVEGKVAISEKPSWLAAVAAQALSVDREAMPAVLLTANQQTLATGLEIAPPEAADALNVTAWTQRRLVFDAMPLSAVIDEFNRYSTRGIELHPALGQLSITASFASTDPASLVRFLQALPNVQVHKTGEITQILQRSR